MAHKLMHSLYLTQLDLHHLYINCLRTSWRITQAWVRIVNHPLKNIHQELLSSEGVDETGGWHWVCSHLVQGAEESQNLLWIQTIATEPLRLRDSAPLPTRYLQTPGGPMRTSPYPPISSTNQVKTPHHQQFKPEGYHQPWLQPQLFEEVLVENLVPKWFGTWLGWKIVKEHIIKCRDEKVMAKDHVLSCIMVNFWYQIWAVIVS